MRQEMEVGSEVAGCYMWPQEIASELVDLQVVEIDCGGDMAHDHRSNDDEKGRGGGGGGGGGMSLGGLTKQDLDIPVDIYACNCE